MLKGKRKNLRCIGYAPAGGEWVTVFCIMCKSGGSWLHHDANRGELECGRCGHKFTEKEALQAALQAAQQPGHW